MIEVAIVRPGPIQGDMVHPYLRRRSGLEPVDYPSEALRQVLGKTMGVPLFQEQAMKIAIVGAGFAPEEADRLRRAMATFKRNGDIHLFRDKFVAGMVANGYERDFAARCFSQIEGFGTYGFPESHAASFALLVYVSAWIKCFYPEVFACALLNSQPMGFYAPAQIVRDAREHGVEVRPVDVNHSYWDCTLELAREDLSPPSPGLDPGIHVFSVEEGRRRAWVAGLSPAKADFELASPTRVKPADFDFRGNDECHGWALRLGLRQIKGFSRGRRRTAGRCARLGLPEPAGLVAKERARPRRTRTPRRGRCLPLGRARPPPRVVGVEGARRAAAALVRRRAKQPLPTQKDPRPP